MAGLVLPRRAATIAAAAAIGLSGTGSWAPGIARATGYDIDVNSATNTVVTVPATGCGVSWDITGAAGGDSASFTGGHGETVTTTTAVPSGGQLLVQPGQRGGSGAGGGGGASIVRVGTSVTDPPLLVVAGGGGAGTQADGGD